VASDALSSNPTVVRRRMWFGILGAPFAWAAQGLLGWFIASAGCGRAPAAARWLTDAGVRGTEIGISVVALLVAISALNVGLQAWRNSADRSIAAVDGRATADFLAAVALVVSVLFTLGILWAALSAFVLSPCESVR